MAVLLALQLSSGPSHAQTGADEVDLPLAVDEAELVGTATDAAVVEDVPEELREEVDAERVEEEVALRRAEEAFSRLMEEQLEQAAVDQDERVVGGAGLSSSQIRVQEEVATFLSSDHQGSLLHGYFGQAIAPEPLVEDSFDIPVVMNERVRFWLEYFQGPGRRHYERWLSRLPRYAPLFQQVMEEHGLPKDLVYLSMIESGFSTHAYSWAHASGPWQFIASTGRIFGLHQDYWIDERRDFEKATHAAARYLKRLHDMFGDWYLAWASYNAGEGKIKRAIARYDTRDFWALARHRYLREETKNYVPKLLAAAIIAKKPERYGFTDIEPLEPLEWETVEVPDATDLKVIARLCGTEEEVLETLNPSLRRWATPPGRTFTLRVPKGSKERFVAEYAKLPPSQRITFRMHRLRQGETLGHVAQRYGISVRAIMDTNRIRNPRRVRAGRNLIIPLPLHRAKSIAQTAGEEAPRRRPKARRATPVAGSGKAIVYRVRRGDTLWTIARRYGVQSSQIAHWNGIRSTRAIHPGDRLKIYVKGEGHQGGGRTYVVAPGDTLWDIARRHNMSVSDLRSKNSLHARSKLMPGQVLYLD